MSDTSGAGGSGSGGGGYVDPAIEKAREDFLSEAQELVDGLSRDLVVLDQHSRTGDVDPELVNDLFRAIHTLKGLAGLFGAARMAAVSHELEELLDDLRLGRVPLGVKVVDLLFRGVELYGLLLLSEKGEAPEPTKVVEEFLFSLGELIHQGVPGAAGQVAQYELDSSILGVLTEYEEHRLRTNMKAGVSLYRIHVNLELTTIDTVLDDIKAAARPFGEIITYLPSGTGSDADHIALDILMASHAELDALRGAFRGLDVAIEAVKKRGGAAAGSGSLPQTPAPPTTGGIISETVSHGSSTCRGPIDGARVGHGRSVTGSRFGDGRSRGSGHRDGRPERPEPRHLSPLREPDGARRHPQARQPDERRGRAGHGPRRAGTHDGAGARRA